MHAAGRRGRRRRRHGAAALARRRRDDPARLRGRAARRAAVRRLGIMRLPDDPTDEGGCEGAIRYFEQGGPEPLHRQGRSALAGAPPRAARSHRRAAARRRQDHRHRRPCRPVDQPGADRADRGGAAAPRASSPRSSRSSASIRAAIAARRCATPSPRCRATCWSTCARTRSSELVPTAISLADRPRPTLILVRSVLKGHMFAFVWLPRDELTTRRRVAIGEMIERPPRAGSPTGRSISATAISLWFATRSTSTRRRRRPMSPRSTRGSTRWSAAGSRRSRRRSAQLVGEARATRLAITYVADLPAALPRPHPAADASRGLLRLRLDGLPTTASRLGRDVQPDGSTRHLGSRSTARRR